MSGNLVQRNTPLVTEECEGQVTVTDPCHPLYGRTLKLSGLARLPGHVRHCQVEVLPGRIVYIPVACTDLSTEPPPGSATGAGDPHRRSPLPRRYPSCQAPLDDVPLTAHDPYQIDPPEPEPVVTRFRVPVVRCPLCRRRIQDRHPEQTSEALRPPPSNSAPACWPSLPT